MPAPGTIFPIYFFPDEKTGAQKVRKGAGHHHLTGPVYIEEADPGDILQVEILDIDPGAYGFNLNPETSFVNLGLLKEKDSSPCSRRDAPFSTG